MTSSPSWIARSFHKVPWRRWARSTWRWRPRIVALNSIACSGKAQTTRNLPSSLRSCPREDAMPCARRACVHGLGVEHRGKRAAARAQWDDRARISRPVVARRLAARQRVAGARSRVLGGCVWRRRGPCDALHRRRRRDAQAVGLARSAWRQCGGRWPPTRPNPDAADDGAAPPVATAMNRRSHAAGVCCIAPCPSTPHLLATGSYDERARLWDARMLRAPLVEHECGGGVWRLKWHPERRDVLLAACMHAGFAVLHVPGLEQPPADAEGTTSSDLSPRSPSRRPPGTRHTDWAREGSDTERTGRAAPPTSRRRISTSARPRAFTTGRCTCGATRRAASEREDRMHTAEHPASLASVHRCDG